MRPSLVAYLPLLSDRKRCSMTALSRARPATGHTSLPERGVAAAPAHRRSPARRGISGPVAATGNLWRIRRVQDPGPAVGGAASVPQPYERGRTMSISVSSRHRFDDIEVAGRAMSVATAVSLSQLSGP